MIAVIFEVWPAEGGREPYLAIAGELRPLLDGIDGFLSIERFESLSEPGKVLSLSFWRDEEAVAAWRGLPAHRDAQVAGGGRCSRLPAPDRWRGERLRDDERSEAPPDSRTVTIGRREEG
jgi:heme-degrading monooxygenase HmoA